MAKNFNKITAKIIGFPGSVLLIPMMFSAIINSFFKGIVNVGEPITSILNGNGVMTLLFIMLFSSGMQLDIKHFGSLLKKSVFLIVIRIVIVVIVYNLYVKLFGIDGIMGISSLVLMIALCSTNPGIFIALVSKYGNHDDLSLFGPLNILTLPAIPLTILSFNSSGGIDASQFIALFTPFIVGVIVGNLKQDLKDKFRSINPIILFFWGFGIGSKIDLTVVLNDLSSSFILIVLFYVLSMLPLVIIGEKIYNDQGLLAIASCSIAAVSLIIPQMAVEIDGIYANYISSATNQLAFGVIVTSLITPFIAKVYNQRKL